MSLPGFRYYPTSDLELRPDVPGAGFFEVALDNAMLSYYEVAPRSRFELHHHASEQITLVLSGQLLFEVEGKEVVVGPGEVIALRSDVPHAVSSLEEPVRAVDAWSPPRASLSPAPH